MLVVLRSRHLRHLFVAATIVTLCAHDLTATVITMKSGMQVEGKIAEMGSLNENPLNPGTEGSTKPIRPKTIGRTTEFNAEISFMAHCRPASAGFMVPQY